MSGGGLEATFGSSELDSSGNVNLVVSSAADLRQRVSARLNEALQSQQDPDETAGGLELSSSLPSTSGSDVRVSQPSP